MNKLVLTCLLAACAAVSARASIICVAPTSTTAGSIQITDPITFRINTAGTAQTFVLSGWVTSDGTATGPTLTPSLAYSLNGTASSTSSQLYDNNATTANDIGANDGYFFFSTTFVVSIGNIVTLSAGTYSLRATANFNPQTTQTFTGNMFVSDQSGVRISNIVSAVPEPGTWGLLGVGVAGLGVVTLRRRRAARA